jgi:hypothetical protein
MSDKPQEPREVLSRAFAQSEFSLDLAEHEFAGERADEGDRLADIALAALKAAGYGLWRKFTDEEEEANNW